MLPILTVVLALILLYLGVTLVLVWVVQKFPRNPVKDPPDWGQLTDTRVPTADGGYLETWRIDAEGPCRAAVVFVHGWGRNRDRMVARARWFGRWGYTCVLFSARDHGRSSPSWIMNGYRFSQDVEAIVQWLGQPVILYGHSAGSAGAIIAASRCPEMVHLLILEGCYADTRQALLSLYRWVHPAFGRLFGPMIVIWMNFFYKGRLRTVSPASLAPLLPMPVLIIHGEKDKRFPVEFARQLHAAFAPNQAELFIADGAGHSDSSHHRLYPAVVKGFLDKHLTPAIKG
jgi:pimeloyl-ACP methyl ester carboxylesterase